MKSRVMMQLLLMVAMTISVIGTTPVTPTTTQTTTPIKIGIFAPYPSASSLSIYGTWTIQGFKLGLIYATGGTNKTIAGRPYQIYTYDTGSSATTATTVATNAIETDGIDIMVGGTSSAAAAALQTVAAQYHKLYFITPGADSSLTGTNFNKYSFRLARNSYQDAITGITYAWDYTGARNYTIIAPAYSFGYSGAQAMQSEIIKRGGNIIDTVYAPLSASTDFTPYMDRLINDDQSYGVDNLIVIWAGPGFNNLYDALSSKNIVNYMNISSGVIDTATMDSVESQLSTGTLVGQTGLSVYGYKLANNSVNDWMVNESISRKIQSDTGYPGSAGSLYVTLPTGYYNNFYVPELFTPDGFATAEFLVNITNNVPNLNVDNMICGLEGMSLMTPKGNETLRPEDHQGLPEMYIATIVNDTTVGSPSYGHLIGQLVKTLSPQEVAPPIETTYKGCTPSSVQTTTISGSVVTTTLGGSSVSTKTVQIPGFLTPMVLLGLSIVVFSVKKGKKNKEI